MARWLQTQLNEEKATRGFPLLEMMLVVACIGILVTLTIQNFMAH